MLFQTQAVSERVTHVDPRACGPRVAKFKHCGHLNFAHRCALATLGDKQWCIPMTVTSQNIQTAGIPLCRPVAPVGTLQKPITNNQATIAPDRCHNSSSCGKVQFAAPRTIDVTHTLKELGRRLHALRERDLNLFMSRDASKLQPITFSR